MTGRSLPHRRAPFIRLGQMVCVAALFISACAPPAMLRAPIPSAATGGEVGIGLGSQRAQESEARLMGAMGWFSFRGQFAESEEGDDFVFIDVGALAHGNAVLEDPNAVEDPGSSFSIGGGTLFRIGVVRDQWFSAALDFEAGWVWGAVSVPIGVRLSPSIWISTAPSLMVGVGVTEDVDVPIFRVPFGLSIKLDEDLLLNLEAGPVIPAANPTPKREAVSLMGGAAIVFHLH